MSRRGRGRYRKKYRKKGWHPYVKASAPAVGYVALRAAKMVADKYLNTEYKFLDTSGSHTPDSSATGTVTALSLMAQGDGESTRDGRQIKATRLTLKWNVNINAVATDTTTRILVFIDRDYDGDAASNVPVWSGTDKAVMESTNVQSFRNLSTVGRYKILMDKSYRLVVGNEYERTKQYQKTWNLNNHIHFTGATANSTDAGRGWICIMTYSSEATNTPTVTFNARLRYLDN